MYWNNSWLNNFNQTIFFNKILFLENIFFFLFSEKIFQNFFEKKHNNSFSEFSKENFFKKFFLKKIRTKKLLKRFNKVIYTKKFRNKKKQNKIVRYNFTKFWFIKFNNYLLVSSFVFFYFKIKVLKRFSTKKTHTLNKTVSIFWKKKKGDNLKKKISKSLSKLEF